MDWLTEPWGVQNLEWAAVPLRIALGVILHRRRPGQVAGRHPAARANWFQSLGFPQPHLLAMGVASLELVGGALLLLGWARPGSRSRWRATCSSRRGCRRRS